MDISKFAATALCVCIAGCANYKSLPSEIDPAAIGPSPATGIVFGRICSGSGLTFELTQADPKAARTLVGAHGGKTSFAIQLPPGTYSLYSMGSRIGPMVADKRMSFTVKAGSIQYIGSFIPQWTDGSQTFAGECFYEEQHVYKTAAFALNTVFGLGKPNWMVNISNYLLGALPGLKNAQPSLDLTHVEVTLMQ